MGPLFRRSTRFILIKKINDKFILTHFSGFFTFRVHVTQRKMYLTWFVFNYFEILFCIENEQCLQFEWDCFNWSKEHQNWSERKWYHVLFFDELKFRSDGAWPFS